MKTLLFWLIVWIFLPMSVMAESFVINQYDVGIGVQSDGSLQVQEMINVTFSEPKHGIERKLPQVYQYSDAQNELIVYDNISINNTYSTYTDWRDLVLRIGDPDVTVDGPQSYLLSYEASPGVIQYSWYQELYRNLVGTQRDTSIDQVSFVISVPEDINLSTLISGDIVIVAWSAWSTWWVTWTIEDNKIIGQTSKLSANQWVTIGIKFANTSFTNLVLPTYVDVSDFDSDQDSNIWDVLWWLAPFLFFIVFGAGKYFIGKYREQQKIKRSWPLVTQYYPPEWVTPAIAGYIDNDQFDTSDFMATLYDWWARWYLTISQEVESKMFGDKTHVIYQKIKTPTDLVPYEQLIWNAMFDGADNFDFDNLDQSMRVNEEQQFFEQVKQAIVNEWNKYYEWSLWWQTITDDWVRIFAHLRGYREFIKTVEQDRLSEFLKQDPLFVDKLLPWAVVFGLETRLLTQLEGLIQRDRPTWYRGNVFNAIILNDMMTNSSKAIDQTYKSAYPSRSSWGWGFGWWGISVWWWGGGWWGWSW